MYFVMVSHGDFAKSLLGSIEMIIGKQENVSVFGLHPEDHPDFLKEQVQDKLKELTEIGQETICFTDLFSGTPFNTVTSLMGKYDVFHITGINLPLMLDAFMTRNTQKDNISAEELCTKLVTEADSTIIDVKKYFEENE